MRKIEIEYKVRDQVHVSDNMNWIATDESGNMVAYENKPIPIDYNKEEDGVWIAPGDFEFIMKIDNPVDWKGSLVKI